MTPRAHGYAEEAVRAHLASTLAELERRGYDARGKSVTEIRRIVAAMDAAALKAKLPPLKQDPLLQG